MKPWTPIDYQAIVCFDQSIVGLLNRYLEDKETILSHAILNAFPEILENEPEYLDGPPLNLHDVVEIFSKKDFYANSGLPNSPSQWDKAIKNINNAFWEYVESIQDCAHELFYQLDLIGLEEWHVRLSQVVGAMKDALIHKSEELIWSIRRLDKQLWKYRLAAEPRDSWSLSWLKLKYRWGTILDHGLLSESTHTQEFLRTNYAKFLRRYRGFILLQEKAEKDVEKISDHLMFTYLDRESQRQFIKLYQLLKLWEFNKKDNTFPQDEIAAAIKNTLSIDKAVFIFKDYYKMLNFKLFEKSLIIKKAPEEYFQSSPVKTSMLESIAKNLAEVNLLRWTINNYRQFLLKNDPDPFSRTRIVLAGSVAGPEPDLTKPIYSIGKEVENLERHYQHLGETTATGQKDHYDLLDIDHELNEFINEISQPLVTEDKSKHFSDLALDTILQLDELGTFDYGLIHYIGNSLLKLMRADWKYSVLYGFPLFHELYSIHLGFVKLSDDRQHLNRLKKFQKLLNQIQEWVKNKKTVNHLHEIELDINDIKIYLQNFLATVQRSLYEVNSPEQLQQHEEYFYKELLEYRYLFGNFFHEINKHEKEGYQIRKQFLFVDQYFDSIEAQLIEKESST